ncbi:MAG: hypothetical protein J2P17_14660, partial [Mycobacterium sp.]|nr:hypothetical protein [Mycobacterium sp.]
MSVDYPPGEWSPLLVGAQWVSGTTLTILTNALANRRATVSNFSNLHETLQSALNSSLAGQEGATADAIRDAFNQGADQAFEIAEKNEAYAKALQHAHNSVIALRQLLTDIAARGNKEINDAQRSNTDSATKVAKISEVIANCQREANQKAAGCADDIMDAGQNVFTAQGTGQSFRGLAHGNSIDNINQQPDLNAIEGQVRGKLDQPAPLGAPSGSDPPESPAPAPAAPSSGIIGSGYNPGANPGMTPPTAPATQAAAPSSGIIGTGYNPGANPGGARVPGGVAPSPSFAGPGFSGAPQMSAPQMPSPLSSPMSAMPPGLSQANLTSMTSGLNTGAPASAPVSDGTSDLPSGPVQAVDSQAAQAAQEAATAPSSGAGAAAAVAAQDMPAPAQHAPSPPAHTGESVSPVMTGTGAGPVSASSASSGGLPAYGADFRPPLAPSTPTTPMSQPPPQPSTVSGSAPIGPAMGGAGLGQPAVASQSGSPTPAHAQPGVGPQVVMAAASGALAGEMSADATAQARLQRLLAAVARQQPLLGWA